MPNDIKTERNGAVAPRPLRASGWLALLFFGLVGQIAWTVENMYFSTLAQDIFSNVDRPDLAYVVTTLMVIFSAITATVTTIFAGGLSDRVGKRRPFIVYGYLLWGLVIMLFGLIPMRPAAALITTVAVLLVVFDCLMTVCGSFANDAAFSAHVTDVTGEHNRGRVNGVLSILPVIAVVILFLGLSPLYRAEAERNTLFFLVLGLIPFLSGLLALAFFRDAEGLTPRREGGYLAATFYGFSPRRVKENPALYLILGATSLVAISQQTFFSYLINFVVRTLGYGDRFVLPMAVIIVGAAALTGAVGFLTDRLGRRHFYYPLLLLSVVGTLSMYLLQFLFGAPIILYLGGILMMGGLLALTGTLGAAFQNRIPKGYEGRFQGVRMCFSVLLPMIAGPLISLSIGLGAMGNEGGFAPTYTIFLAAAIVGTLSAVPLFFVRRFEK